MSHLCKVVLRLTSLYQVIFAEIEYEKGGTFPMLHFLSQIILYFLYCDSIFKVTPVKLPVSKVIVATFATKK
ncbi:TPA: hypothetical protein DEG21_04550 [Patescibacteria group bacterium]|nr:hypothetical protein [Candidatus Gracilibacteria bacterium]HBY75106.1 hypothetical protein [Candidatus Gracilibacteria bacterium]